MNGTLDFGKAPDEEVRLEDLGSSAWTWVIEDLLHEGLV